MTPRAFHDEVIAFLRTTSDIELPPQVGADTNLLDFGLLDSLRLVELVLFLEERLGTPIALEKVDAAVFHTTASMYRTFVEPAGTAHP